MMKRLNTPFFHVKESSFSLFGVKKQRSSVGQIDNMKKYIIERKDNMEGFSLDNWN